jgi:hypothetical protein
VFDPERVSMMTGREWWCAWVGVAVVLGVAPGSLFGQAGPVGVGPAGPPVLVSAGRPTTPPTLAATRLVTGAIRVDGHLDEAAWAQASIASGFVQYEPDPGLPASQRTEARVLYADDALYVAIRAWDTAADSIKGQLTRRDQGSYSDLLGVVVDSYFDRRTAFHFEVNPLGVKRDLYRYEDTREDVGWDAVWEVATSVDDEGWSAEFRIPLSQLRFRDAPEQTWGINFLRHIARHDETVLWAPTARADAAIVSRFGRLEGIRDLVPPRRLEVTPYVLARVRRAPGNLANPFYTRNAAFGTAGADLRYGVTSDLTLNVTINPDFGQVEADPAQVNLSAYETFLPERRPFFQEGADLFNFSIALGDGDDAVESLFYSRRIGRAPQGSADPRGGWVDTEEQTTILAAWKLSGKTAGGWSIGLMSAVTSEETAEVAPAQGERLREPVEPFTNHAVARAQRDFRQGRTAAGVVATAVNREAEVANTLGLRTGAYAAGLDVRHRFGDDRFQFRGYLLGSHLRGSPDAIASVQRNPARYFQRPDADHVTYDPTRRALSGASGALTLHKVAGGGWRYGTGVQTRSPGFDVNDAGYLREADFTAGYVYAGYDHSSPQGIFRRWRLNTNLSGAWSYGGERYSTSVNVNGNVQFTNSWNAYFGVNRSFAGLSNGLLRGGPAMRRDPSWNGWGGLGTDGRRPVQLNLNTSWNVRPESDSWSAGMSPSVRWRPSGRASVSIGTGYYRTVEDGQWVGRFGSVDDPAYLFGRLDQTTVSFTGRMDFAFTPSLSLQLYAQPFVSAGRYQSFRRVTDPRAPSYQDRFAPVTLTTDGTGVYRGDITGDASEESFQVPDFNVAQFRSNAVLRWEYRPGSTLFVVWAQGRNGMGDPGRLDMNGDLQGLFDVRPSNTLMVKASYWLNP